MLVCFSWPSLLHPFPFNPPSQPPLLIGTRFWVSYLSRPTPPRLPLALFLPRPNLLPLSENLDSGTNHAACDDQDGHGERGDCTRPTGMAQPVSMTSVIAAFREGARALSAQCLVGGRGIENHLQVPYWLMNVGKARLLKVHTKKSRHECERHEDDGHHSELRHRTVLGRGDGVEDEADQVVRRLLQLLQLFCYDNAVIEDVAKICVGDGRYRNIASAAALRSRRLALCTLRTVVAKTFHQGLDGIQKPKHLVNLTCADV